MLRKFTAVYCCLSLLCVGARQDMCWLPITFLSKRPTTLNTAETLWVPVLIQSSDHFLNEKRIKKSNVFKRDETFKEVQCYETDTRECLNLLRLIWACCSVHSEGRKGWSSLTRNMAVHPFQRSYDCPTLSHTQCTQSALGATPSPEPSPPGRGNS